MSLSPLPASSFPAPLPALCRALLVLSSVVFVGIGAACGSCTEAPVRCSTASFCPVGSRCEDDVCVPVDERSSLGVDDDLADA
ncbi:MAG: hypothetical protein FJ137_18030, partial [Deltaproteobacteria bacterium]|nr:hypothetical protein [Deltaproteobacteria bacterium]